MRLDLIQYFLAVFVLPSAAKSHQIVSHTKFMASGIKVSAIDPCQTLGDTEPFVGSDRYRGQCGGEHRRPRSEIGRRIA